MPRNQRVWSANKRSPASLAANAKKSSDIIDEENPDDDECKISLQMSRQLKNSSLFPAEQRTKRSKETETFYITKLEECVS